MTFVELLKYSYLLRQGNEVTRLFYYIIVLSLVYYIYLNSFIKMKFQYLLI